MKYGNPPTDLGAVDVALDEVMYYLYLPIKLAGQQMMAMPDALQPLWPMMDVVVRDLVKQDRYTDHYIYVTVKKMFVGGGVTANRPGWHADGFGTDDLNYIWYDCVPTLFNTSEFTITEDDHVKSLVEYAEQALPQNDVVYPCGHVLRLDPSVVHRVAEVEEQVMRTFVKISVSKDKYNLKDNSINRLLDYDWKKYDRATVRNDPNHAQRDSYTESHNPVDDHLI